MAPTILGKCRVLGRIWSRTLYLLLRLITVPGPPRSLTSEIHCTCTAAATGRSTAGSAHRVQERLEPEGRLGALCSTDELQGRTKYNAGTRSGARREVISRRTYMTEPRLSTARPRLSTARNCQREHGCHYLIQAN